MTHEVRLNTTNRTLMTTSASRYFYKVLNHRFRVVDGDTVDCLVDLGFNCSMWHRFRMLGYDAPETYRPKNDAERVMGKSVKEFLTTTCDSALRNDGLYVKSLGAADAYGRYVCELFMTEGVDLISINTLVMSYMNQHQMTKESIGIKSNFGNNTL